METQDKIPGLAEKLATAFSRCARLGFVAALWHALMTLLIPDGVVRLVTGHWASGEWYLWKVVITILGSLLLGFATYALMEWVRWYAVCFQSLLWAGYMWISHASEASADYRVAYAIPAFVCVWLGAGIATGCESWITRRINNRVRFLTGLLIASSLVVCAVLAIFVAALHAPAG